MAEAVYAKISTNRINIYFAGRSMQDIREDLVQFDYEPSKLVEVSEKEASQMPYFKQGKLAILVNRNECFHIGSTYEKQKFISARNQHLFWFVSDN